MLKGYLANYTDSDLPDNIKIGLIFLKNTDFDELQDGRYTISDSIYVNIQTYTTKSDADFEAHKEYTDIQYMIKGREKIGVSDYNTCQEKIPYNPEKDIEFLYGDGEYHILNEGEFMILYPEDAHKPSISINSAESVRKAVVKVLKD